MHGSVLQNKKYIEFAEKNTVEVLTLDIQTGISRNDERAATYTAKDASGNDVEYLVEFPNLTVEMLDGMNSSGAAKYSSRGVPYTVIVNPHTLEEMESFLGGQAAGALMDAIAIHRKALQKEHGKGVSRKDLAKLAKEEADIRASVTEGKVHQALADVQKLARKFADEPQPLQDRVNRLVEEALAAAGKQLDEAEGMIAKGDAAAAARMLSPLARALKGTPHEERANQLLEQARGA